MVKAPVLLLLDPDLPATAKVIWLVSQTQAHTREIQAATGFARATILRGQALLAAKSWSSEPTVTLPQELLEDPGVDAQAKVLHGVLKLRSPSGQFTFAELSTLVGLSPNTLKNAVNGLASAGWLRVTRKNRLAPIFFTLTTPEGEQQREEVDRLRRRIRRAKHTGEAIMREYLSLLVGAQDYEDNAYMSFLRNPFTGEMMQLDRYYRVGVAFEFNGPQHYESDDEDELARQKARDHMKRGMCRDAGVALEVVHPEDLSLQGMRRKIGDLLPMRDIKGREALARVLESETWRYLATAGDWTGPSRRP